MSELATKLQIKAGQSLAVINAPKEPQVLLNSELNGISFVSAGRNADATLVFVRRLADVKSLVLPALKSARLDSLFLVAYPKGSSGVKTDVNRDRLADALNKTGWRPVRLISLDEVWSVMRIRPKEKVRGK